jgi:DNA polymerase-3 subunit delta
MRRGRRTDVKASKSSVGRTVDQPDPKVRFYLFLGPDEAQSRALATRLLEGLGAQKFVVNLASVKSNPGLLADEAAALSLFGEKRLVWIEPAGNDLLEGVESLLAADAVESPVVAIAGALPRSSVLLKLAESSPAALAFTAYAPEGDEAARLVADLGRRVGLKVRPPVAARIADSCGNDQAIIARELEKLSIYVGASPHSPKELDHEAVDAVGADSGEGDFQHLADLALLGEVAELADSIARLPAGSSEAIPAVRSLQRRLLMLAPARARIERGERVDAVMTSFGKALFWKDKNAVARMLTGWSAVELARVAERAGALERNLLFSDAPERESLGEELLAIARKARSLR